MTNIKLFGDVHLNDWNKYKLYRISNVINATTTNYVVCTGDLVDSNNFLDNRDNKNLLLDWIKSIASKAPFIICLGNHDIFRNKDGKWVKANDIGFWAELNSISGVHLIDSTGQFIENKPFYTDKSIYAAALTLPFEYYETGSKTEDINIFLKELNQAREHLTGLDEKKLNILLCHSPVYITDPSVIPNIEEFKICCSGHMHNGVIPPLLDKFLPGNWGLISPQRGLFPQNARGIIYINQTELIITGGITKLPTGSLDPIWPGTMEEIGYNEDTHKTNVKTLKLR